MASVQKTTVQGLRAETRKAWGTPQLRKFGVEEITAQFHNSNKTDSSSSHS